MMPERLQVDFDPTGYSRISSQAIRSPTTGQVPSGTQSDFLRYHKTGELKDRFDFMNPNSLTGFGGTGGYIGGQPVSDERWQQMLSSFPTADQSAPLPDTGPPLPLPPGAMQQKDPVGDMERWRQSLKDWKANGMVGPRPMMPGSSPQPQAPRAQPRVNPGSAALLSRFLQGGMPGVGRVSPQAGMLLRLLMGRR